MIVCPSLPTLYLRLIRHPCLHTFLTHLIAGGRTPAEGPSDPTPWGGGTRDHPSPVPPASDGHPQG